VFADESEALVTACRCRRARPAVGPGAARDGARPRPGDRTGYRACLTNNVSGEHSSAEQAETIGAIMARFEHVVESSKVGVRKPEPAIYEMACERLGISPHEAVYLDDLGINLKPAKAMGMATIKVADPDVAIAELEQLTGLSLK
jgi:putative hydrolase of the HAD superfamily